MLRTSAGPIVKEGMRGRIRFFRLPACFSLAMSHKGPDVRPGSLGSKDSDVELLWGFRGSLLSGRTALGFESKKPRNPVDPTARLG